MTKVRLGHRPEEVVDLEDAEIEDLRRMGVRVQEAEGSGASEQAQPVGDSGTSRKGK